LSKVLTVHLDINGTELSVMVLHLKSGRGGLTSDQQRIAQASIIRRVTLTWIQDARHFVVMGDLNADIGRPSLRRIRGRDDVQADLIQVAHADEFTGDKWTQWFDGRGYYIDHILMSPSLRGWLRQASVLFGHAPTISDHFPLVTVVDVP
jgi:endonuclease/exonuclease/phosphatase family metal-dependent hydrolase